MKKNRTKCPIRKAPVAAPPEPPRRVPLGEVLVTTKTALRELVLGAGFQVFAAMLEEDRDELCGPRYQPQQDRQAYRYGHTEGRVVLGGRKVTLPRPRVRSVEGEEMKLPTWATMTREDPLGQRSVEQMVVGVSTRKYARSLEPTPEDVSSSAMNRSSVSRRFVARTSEQVRTFLSRPLDEAEFPVIMVDGTGLGESVLVVALGIDRTGKKHILGVVEGSTESEAVCSNLFRSLIERGLVVETGRLFILDGGKGLRKAVREVFGSWALVHRCQLHKLRNVLEHLPESKRTWVRAAMNKAYGATSTEKARRRLLDLIHQLEDEHPGAAGSLKEGLDESLTLLDLGVTGLLYSSLRTTNTIENLQGTIKRIARNVKKWRGGKMALRWAVTGLLEAEKNFRRIKGCKTMPTLIVAIQAHIVTPDLDTQAEVA